jgi:hypothetical protein
MVPSWLLFRLGQFSSSIVGKCCEETEGMALSLQFPRLRA